MLASFLGIAAAGQTLVILIGGIDLSVPALISGANLVSTLLSGKGWPFGLVSPSFSCARPSSAWSTASSSIASGLLR